MSFFEQERVFNNTAKQQTVPDYGWNKQQKRFFNHPNNLLKKLFAAEYTEPSAVIGKIADLVRCKQLSIIAGQQILPRTVAVAIGDGIQCRAQRAGGVGERLWYGQIGRTTTFLSSLSLVRTENASLWLRFGFRRKWMDSCGRIVCRCFFPQESPYFLRLAGPFCSTNQ